MNPEGMCINTGSTLTADHLRLAMRVQMSIYVHTFDFVRARTSISLLVAVGFGRHCNRSVSFGHYSVPIYHQIIILF